MYATKATAVILAFGLVHGEVAAQDASGAAIEVEAAIALGVEDRQPVDAGTEFAADVGQLFAWTRITGAANTVVEHVWRHGPHESVVPVTISGSPWRVWTTKTIPPEWTGEWTFEVRDADGNVASTSTFTVGG